MEGATTIWLLQKPQSDLTLCTKSHSKFVLLLEKPISSFCPKWEKEMDTLYNDFLMASPKTPP